MGCPIALDTSQWRYHDPLPLSLSSVSISGGGLLDSLDSPVRLFRFFYGRPRHGMYGGKDGATPVSYRRNWLGGWPWRTRKLDRTRNWEEREGGRERVCVWRSRVHWPKIILACRAVVPRRPPSIPVTSHRFHASSSSLFPSFLLVEISW